MNVTLLTSFEDSGVYNTATVGDFDLISDNYATGISGWRISPNGDAEFQNVVVRGAIYSSSGQIGGLNIYNSGFSSNRMSLDSISGIIVVRDAAGVTATTQITTSQIKMQNAFGTNTAYMTNYPSIQLIGGVESSVPILLLTKTSIFGQNNIIQLYSGIGASGGLGFANTEFYEYSKTLCSLNAGLRVENVGNYANNAAAISAGLISGQLYRNGDVLQIVH